MTLRTNAASQLPLKAALLGAMTGLRSSSGLAALSWLDGAPGLFPRLASAAGRSLAGAALAGELVVDKLPSTPSRLTPPQLGGRLFFGALCGALVYQAAKAPAWRGATVGGLAALGAAVAGSKLRAAVGKRTGAKDHWVAIGEDALAVGLGVAAARG